MTIYVMTALLILATGCASTPASAKPQSASGEPAAVPAADAKPKRVSLPYRFTRRGVTLQSDSVEFSEGQVLVNLTCEETRNTAVELPAATLLRVQTSSGEALDYLHYSRLGQIHKEPAIALVPLEKISITLVFKSAAGASASPQGPLELHFPTGKYWSSQAAD